MRVACVCVRACVVVCMREREREWEREWEREGDVDFFIGHKKYGIVCTGLSRAFQTSKVSKGVLEHIQRYGIYYLQCKHREDI